MDKKEVLEKVQDIFRDVLDNDDIELRTENTADDIENWDSLNHIQIVAEIQDFYKIKFSAREMISWDNVGDMCESILSKLQ